MSVELKRDGITATVGVGDSTGIFITEGDLPNGWQKIIVVHGFRAPFLVRLWRLLSLPWRYLFSDRIVL